MSCRWPELLARQQTGWWSVVGGRSCRASWPHIAQRLSEHRDELDTHLRKEMVRTLKLEDEVVLDLMSRHLARCVAAEDLQLDELSWLLGVLLDTRLAGPLIEALLEWCETGLEESWYEVQLRRKYGGQSQTPRQDTVCTNGLYSPRPQESGTGSSSKGSR